MLISRTDWPATVAPEIQSFQQLPGKPLRWPGSGVEVYGWMLDHFHRGLEVNNLPAGMKELEPYLEDPNCLGLSTKKEIEL